MTTAIWLLIFCFNLGWNCIPTVSKSFKENQLQTYRWYNNKNEEKLLITSKFCFLWSENMKNIKPLR